MARQRSRLERILRKIARTVYSRMEPYVPHWRERIKLAVKCPDNQYIPRVADAGQVRGDIQTMHNGLRIKRGSYYGRVLTRLLRKNRGVHEPQEERAFAAVLPYIKPGGVMLELGAFWAFYSMWFCRDVKAAHCYMVEPAKENLEMGRANFALNGLSGDFLHAYVGRQHGQAEDGTRVIGVDQYLAERQIDRLDILHCDIQGYEVDMLKGAGSLLGEERVAYLFISTHSQQLHSECLAILRGHGYQIMDDCDLDDTYSFDGLIVARAPGVQGPEALNLSKRSRVTGH